MVSPGRGNLSLNVVKSTLALPTTAILGVLPMCFLASQANAKIYHGAPDEQAARRHFFALHNFVVRFKLSPSHRWQRAIFRETVREGDSHDWRHAHDFLQ